jgi:carbon storage regulator
MLVLTRKSDESIVIRDDIEVTVLSISGNTVRLGITAPKGVLILRKELLPVPPPTDEAAHAA